MRRGLRELFEDVLFVLRRGKFLALLGDAVEHFSFERLGLAG